MSAAKAWYAQGVAVELTAMDAFLQTVHVQKVDRKSQLVVQVPPPVNREGQVHVGCYFPLHATRSTCDWRLTHLH